jgi:EmrB/QacA subfamily drug resistance transporter
MSRYAILTDQSHHLENGTMKWIPPTGHPCDEGILLSSPAAAPCSARSAPWILAATILGSSMAFIDGTAVNLALPALQTNFHATVSDMQWVVEAYALLLAALLLAGGSLGDIYGRKRIYVIGIVIFAAASTWCGIATHMSELIAARAIQGVGGALLVPGSLAIIGASFHKQERGKAIGTWSGFTSITTAAGPVLGGFLIEHASWRWAFFINLPLALAVLVLTVRHVPESRNVQAGTTLDWPGVVLVTTGLGGLVYGLIESSRRAWNDPGLIASIALGTSALIAFVAVEAYSRTPLLPLRLFRSRDFSGVNLLTLLLYSALSGLLFFFPLNLIQVQRYSATAAGAALLPMICLMFLLSRWSGGLVDRYGARLPLVIGPVIVAAGFALFARSGTGGSYWTTFFPAVVVLGFGMAASVAPLTTTVMNSVSENYAGTASGINNAVSRLAALLAIAVFGIIMVSGFNRNLSSRLAVLHLESGTLQKIESQRERLAAIEIPQDLESDSTAKVRESIDDSFLAGFRLVMFTASGMALLSAGTAWLIIEKKPRN